MSHVLSTRVPNLGSDLWISPTLFDSETPKRKFLNNYDLKLNVKDVKRYLEQWKSTQRIKKKLKYSNTQYSTGLGNVFHSDLSKHKEGEYINFN